MKTYANDTNSYGLEKYFINIEEKFPIHIDILQKKKKNTLAKNI